MTSARRPRQLPVQVAMGCGLLVLVIGTFLPWLTSGRVQRSSFAAGAAVRTLLDVHGAACTALRGWPAVVGVAAIAVALLALDLPRVAIPIAGAAAVVAGGVSVAVLGRPSHGLVRLSHAGPLVTLLGSALTVASIAAYFLQQDRDRRRNQ